MTQNTKSNFNYGDFVTDLDGTRFGYIDHITGPADDRVYKVQQLNGPRHYWPESGLRKLRTDEPEFVLLAAAREAARLT